MEGWQHIPESINPIAFSVGFFSVRWYAILFFFGSIAAIIFILWLRKKEGTGYSEEDIYDMFFVVFLGVYIGARLGYVLFYNRDFFLEDPLRVILPYDFSRGIWIGISGMSFHGGLMGATVALYWFSRRKKIAFWVLADVVALAAPIALFFGRLGNFFNLELYGRVTEMPWGMYFPGTSPLGVLRHPAPIYEALLEGVILFFFLLCVRFRREKLSSGVIAAMFLMGYAVLRFIGEYFREPDPQIGFIWSGLTLGQAFSLCMFIAGVGIFSWFKWQNRDTIERQERNIQ